MDEVDSANANELLIKFSRAAEYYMRKSGNVPLSLDIDTSNLANVSAVQGRSVNDLHCEALVSSFLPHFHRWRHVFLRTPLNDMVPVFSFLSQQKTQLETLSLDFSCTPSLGFLDSAGRRDAFIVPLDMGNAPQMEGVIMYGNWDDRLLVEWNPGASPATLRCVMLWNVHLSIKGLPRNLVIPQLNSLQKLCLSTYLPPVDLLCLLRSSPELEELTLDVRLNGSDFDSSPLSFATRVDFSLAKLHTFRVYITESMAELFEYFAVPALRRLEVSTGRGPEVPLLPRLVSLLSRSKASLDFVMIQDSLCNVREEQLIELLGCLEPVEELKVLAQGLSDITLQALTMESDVDTDDGCESGEEDGDDWDARPRQTPGSEASRARSLCPNLISLAFSAGNKMSPRALRRMILSRTNPPLSVVKAVVPRPETITEDTRIGKLVKDGLVLDLRDSSSYIPVFS